ncbi:hypothetical protein B5S32_g4444 [[Candida] boidinii]|nr:hypothetical protein B5S29_g4967 [[Candida] boidinii]OWB80187.1 hypothetical protein B5S32_g4444 [[Candida] boidinii]
MTVKASDIYFFIPNQIGFARVVTAILSFFLMKDHPKFTTIIYGISCLLDAFDGMAARKYNQSTKFGAVLDMVTDRCSTTSLICFLSAIYPNWCILWQILVSLDLSSHYIHMYASLSSGSTSHKKIDDNQNFLLKLYYSNRNVLFIVCFFNEAFYMALYLSYYDIYKLPLINLTLPQIVAYISFPIWFFKQITNIIQLCGAAHILADLDAKERNINNNKSN